MSATSTAADDQTSAEPQGTVPPRRRSRDWHAPPRRSLANPRRTRAVD